MYNVLVEAEKDIVLAEFVAKHDWRRSVKVDF